MVLKVRVEVPEGKYWKGGDLRKPVCWWNILNTDRCCCCCSVAQLCPTLCVPMDCSTSGLPVLHYLPKFAQIHVHPAISSSDALFSFCPQSLPASGTCPMSQQFASDDHNTGASASVLPMSIQGWFPLSLTGLISLLSRGLSGVFSSTTVQRHKFFGALPSLQSKLWSSQWSHMVVQAGLWRRQSTKELMP